MVFLNLMTLGKNIQFNFHGGAEWPGGSYNIKNGHLYITSSNIAWETK